MDPHLIYIHTRANLKAHCRLHPPSKLARPHRHIHHTPGAFIRASATAHFAPSERVDNFVPCAAGPAPPPADRTDVQSMPPESKREDSSEAPATSPRSFGSGPRGRSDLDRPRTNGSFTFERAWLGPLGSKTCGGNYWITRA